jgi:hypothetical protein
LGLDTLPTSMQSKISGKRGTYYVKLKRTVRSDSFVESLSMAAAHIRSLR